jgi:DNA-binding response OmpR family regulator
MRILLVEDQAALREPMAEGLRKAGFAVDTAASLAEADALLAVDSVDLMILDLGLPDGDGRAYLIRLRRAGRRFPVLVVTARGGLDDRVGSLDDGADDYLVKPFAMAELAARCRALLRRPGGSLGVVLTCGPLALDSVGRQATLQGEVLPLTRREFDLLTLLLRRSGHVVSRDMIVSTLYEMEEETSPNAIEVAVSRLRKRLAAAPELEIHTLRGIGYLLREKPAT